MHTLKSHSLQSDNARSSVSRTSGGRSEGVFESDAYSLCDTVAFSELTVALNGTKVGALVRGTRTHQLDHCFGGCKVCFRRYIF